MDTAPFYADLAEGPTDGRAVWVEAEDGVRLRAVAWQPASAARGTVLVFAGRTEYAEKYGRVASDFAAAGLATLLIDWRGQGLSDRLTGNAMTGHVHLFDDYQLDVAAMGRAAGALNLPKPWVLLGHSMGGCIGLRALMNGLPVAAASFSAPMWGIRLTPAVRAVAWSLSWGGRGLGLGDRFAPGTTRDSYLLSEPYGTNRLTGDSEGYAYMVKQVKADPRLGLGGPSYSWLYEALRETRALSRLPSPDLPCLTFLGTDEDIVDVPRIHDRMTRWPGGTLDLVEGGRHEVLMEGRDLRRRLTGRLIEHYEAAIQARPTT